MSRPRRSLCAVYLAIAALALIGTWRQNLAFMAEAHADLAGAFAVFWPRLLVNHATTSITVDIFLFGLAAMIWMVLEARRLGVRFVWLYVLLAFTVAISVTFPLFLAARERRLAARGDTGSEPAMGLADRLGLAALGAATCALVIWCTVR